MFETVSVLDGVKYKMPHDDEESNAAIDECMNNTKLFVGHQMRKHVQDEKL